MNTVWERTSWSVDHEIIIKLKNGSFDWIDPLSEVYEDEENLIVINSCGNEYKYSLVDIEKYRIRIYNSENIYDV